MIRIRRASPPSILCTSTGQDRYRKQEVVETLRKMQHGKCCYCEKYLPPAGPGRPVEHFRPQSLYPSLKFDWKNLLLACGTCNWSKRASFPITWEGDPILLDPSDSDVDPENHIEFIVSVGQGHIGEKGMAVPRDASTRGRISIKTLGLSKEHHIKERSHRVDELQDDYIDLMSELIKCESGCGDTQKIGRLKQKLQECTRDTRNYAGVGRTFHRRMQLHKVGVARG